MRIPVTLKPSCCLGLCEHRDAARLRQCLINEYPPKRERIFVINTASTTCAQDNARSPQFACGETRLPRLAEGRSISVVLTHRAECRAVTSQPPDFVDLTDEIQDVIASSQIRHGRVTVFAPDAACAILINERESGLLQDIKGAIARLHARSDHGNAVVGSSSIVVPVVDGKISLGTWQRVLLVELGAASERNVAIQIVGETED